ncbi:MAG: hypothetical protein WD604_05030 [Balneolaceae bacterium]
MKKNIIITFLFFALQEALLTAQNTSTAVMEVKAEVITGASVLQNSWVDVFAVKGDEISFGNFFLVLPDGAQVLTYSPDDIEMQSDLQIWHMQTMMESTGKDTVLELRFSTRATNSGLKKDLYKGVQIATIEYL